MTARIHVSEYLLANWASSTYGLSPLTTCGRQAPSPVRPRELCLRAASSGVDPGLAAGRQASLTRHAQLPLHIQILGGLVLLVDRSATEDGEGGGTGPAPTTRMALEGAVAATATRVRVAMAGSATAEFPHQPCAWRQHHRHRRYQPPRLELVHPGRCPPPRRQPSADISAGRLGHPGHPLLDPCPHHPGTRGEISRLRFGRC